MEILKRYFLKFTVQYEGQKMNKTHFLCLRTDAQKGEEEKKITDVENWRSFSNSKQLVHGRIGLGLGIIPINSNRTLNTAIRASQYNAMYMYICIYILAVC